MSDGVTAKSMAEARSHHSRAKRLAARYFFHYELPETTAQFDLLHSCDRTTIDLDENLF